LIVVVVLLCVLSRIYHHDLNIYLIVFAARGRNFLQLDEIPSFEPTAFPVAELATTQQPSEAPKFFRPSSTPTESPISIADTPSDAPVAVEPTPEPIADLAPSSAPIGLGPAPTESPISIADTPSDAPVAVEPTPEPIADLAPSSAPIAVKPTANIESTPTTSPVEIPTSSPVDFPTPIASEREIYYHQVGASFNLFFFFPSIQTDTIFRLMIYL
jgi:hypothetical protein